MSIIIRKGLWLILAISVTGIAGYALLSQHKQPAANREPPNVTVQSLAFKTIPLTVTSYAQVISPSSVILSAKTDGIITALNFKPGQLAKKGDSLATLETTDSDSQVKGLEAQLRLSNQRRERTKQLANMAQGTVSELDLLQLKTEYERDLAHYQSAKAVHTIAAPVDGVVSDTHVAPGDFVKSGEPIVYLVNQKDREIKYHLPSQYAEQVKLGQAVIFSSSDGRHTVSATVSYISPLLDNKDYSLTVRARLQDATVKPNTFGQVRHQLNPAFKTLAIDHVYVHTDAQGFYVFSVDQGKVIKRYFTPGELTKSGLIEIKAGLPSGTTIITSNPENLNEGQTVKVIPQ